MIIFGAIALLITVIAAVFVFIAWHGNDDAVCGACGWHLPGASARELRRTHTACPKCEGTDWI